MEVLPTELELVTDKEYQALQRIKAVVNELFDIEQLILFGSVARGEADEESDIDLLLVTKYPLDRWQRHQITNAVCEVNKALN